MGISSVCLQLPKPSESAKPEVLGGTHENKFLTPDFTAVSYK
jgi:hypothetical protein